MTEQRPPACAYSARGKHEAGRIAEARIVAGAARALPDPPAVVAAEGDDVDLLDRALAHVAGVEVAGAAVEGEPPRVAEAVGVDLVRPGVAPKNGLLGGEEYGTGPFRSIHVDAENLAEQLVDVLRAVAGIVARAAVAHPDVEEAVRAELHHAAVVVREGLRDHEEHGLGRVRDVGIRRGGAIFRDHRWPRRSAACSFTKKRRFEMYCG